MGAWVYMLRCADGSFYTGLTRHEDVGVRVNQHAESAPGTAYTSKRLPVELVWAEWFERYDDAFASERRIKGWSRAKKEALIERDYARISRLARRKGERFVL